MVFCRSFLVVTSLVSIFQIQHTVHTYKGMETSTSLVRITFLNRKNGATFFQNERGSLIWIKYTFVHIYLYTWKNFNITISKKIDCLDPDGECVIQNLPT